MAQKGLKNTFQNNRLTIGLMTNQIEGRFQAQIWQAISEYLETQDVNLVVFAGKALKSPFEGDNQHNFIFDLADPEKLDGLIIPTQVIGNYIGSEELDAFLKPYLSIPLVSISACLEGIPSVVIDNEAMGDLIDHLIEVHGHRRILFIKGKEKNKEANERFAQYCKSLTAHGIPIDPELIFEGDFSYQSGRDAIKKILGQKELKYDVIAAANDDMAFACLDEINRLGMTVPDDIALTGYDNAYLLEQLVTKLTTVHQPISEVSVEACKVLLKMIRHENVPAVTVLRGKLIVRESCGCRPLMLHDEQLSKIIPELHSPLALRENIRKIIPVAYLTAAELESVFGDIDSFIEIIDLQLKAVRHNRSQPFKDILKKHIKMFPQLDFWKVLLVLIRQYCLKKFSEPKELEILNMLFEGYQIDLSEMRISQEVQKERKLMGFFWYLYDIKRKINHTFDINLLTVNLFQEMSAKSVHSIYISLFQRGYSSDDRNSFSVPLHSEMILAYDENGLLITGDKPKLFFTKQLFPTSVLNSNKRYSLIIMPLINWEDKFGIIALPTTDIEPIMYEFLREEISNIIYTIITFQQKKEIEEKLEYNMRELKKSEERFKDMATFLPTVIMETDLYFRIVYLGLAEKFISNQNQL